MAGMFDMMKKAASMKKQMKKMQKELARKVVSASSGPVTVSARGDMVISSINIEPEEVNQANASRLEKSIVAAVNKALDAAKRESASQMSQMSGGLGGLADMLG